MGLWSNLKPVAKFSKLVAFFYPTYSNEGFVLTTEYFKLYKTVFFKL